MADDNLTVGIDLDAGGLGREAADAAAVFSRMVASIQTMSKELRESVNIARQFGDVVRVSAQSQEKLAKEQKALLNSQQLGDNAARNRILSQPSPNGGTLRDDQIRSFGTKALITSLGSSDAQLEAQLKQAGVTLGQRLVRTTTEALTATMARTVFTQQQTNASFNNPAFMQARANQLDAGRISTIQKFGSYSSGADYVLQQQQEKFAAEQLAAIGRRSRMMLASEAVERRRLAAEERAARAAEGPTGRSFGERIGARAQLVGDYVAIGAVAGGATQTARGIGDLDDALTKFSAITQTSNTELGTFKDRLLEIGQTSRFSIKELTEVATTLGQTGLSASEVIKVLPSVTAFATAAGTSLTQGVDLIASAIGAYNLQASQAGDLANVFTGALNQTKLTVDQLSQGFSYSANIAKEAGVSYTELTAVLGGLAQAGIRAGSTLGTGTRQLIQELSAPSDKLLAALRPLGISLNDIDIKANGLVGALDNLRAKGFSTADALRTLDLRAASAYTALAGQSDTIKRLQESLLLSNSASEGASRASESLYAGFQRLGNTVFSIVDKAFSPLVSVLKVAVGAMTSLFGALVPLGPALGVVALAATGIGTAFAAIKFGTMLTGIAAIAPALSIVSGGLGTLALALGALANPIVLGLGAAAAAGLLIWGNAADALTEKLDKLKAKDNELMSAQNQNQTSVLNINSTIDSLIERREKLNNDPMLRRVAIIEAQKAFSDLGLSVKSGATNIDELIGALRNLRNELSAELPSTLEKRIDVANKSIEAMLKQAAANDKLTQGKLPEAQSRRLAGKLFPGQDLNGAIDFVSGDITKMDPANAMSQSAEFKDQIRKLQIGANGNESQTKFLNLLLEQIKDRENRLNNIQSNILQRDNLMASKETETIRSRRSYTDVQAGKEGLYDDLRTGLGDVNSQVDMSPTDKLARLNALSETLKAKAKGLVDQLGQYETELRFSGKSDEEIAVALGPLRDALMSLSKGAVTQITDVRKAAQAADLDLQKERSRGNREQQRTVQTLLRGAKTTQDVDFAEAKMKELIEKEREIEIAMARNKAENPDKLSSEERAIIDDINVRIDEKLTASTETFGQKRLAMVEAFLAFESKVLGAEEGKINAQIAELRKILSDPSTTVAKAKELQEQILKLIQQGIDIVQRQSTVDMQRSQLGVPSGPVALNGNAGAVAQGIAQALAGMNRSDLLNTALKFGQQESGLNLNPAADAGKGPQGARGLFQFIPSTWRENGGGDIGSLEDQVKAFVSFMSRIDKALGSIPATDFNRYVVHQQGVGGGPALLKADPNALASSVVPQEHVTRNGGSANSTVAEFLSIMRGQFERAEKAVGGITTSAGDLARIKKEETDEKARADGRRGAQGDQRTIDALEYRKAAVAAGLATKSDEAGIRAKAAGIERTDSSVAAEKLVLEIVGMLSSELKRELELIEKDPKYREDPDAKAAAIAATRERFAERFNRDVTGNAKKAADQDSNVLDQQLKRLQAERDANAEMGKGTIELDRQIYALQQRVSLSQPVVEKERELAILSASIAAAKLNGLGTDESLALAVERQAVLQREILALKGKQQAVSKAMASEPSFMDAFTKGSQDFFKQSGMLQANGNFKTLTMEMSGYWTEALGGMQSGLSSLFKNLASGTMKAGDAFKQFATSVIGNMLDIASKAVSNEILKMLFGGSTGGGGGFLSGLMGLFGGGGGGGAVDLGGGVMGFANGGVVRASTGFSPTRDSKLILAQPGEGIVRKSAMEMLGSDGLDEVNVMANRRFSQAKVAPPRPKVPDNVNVWVVSPENVPPPGPKDIVHAVASDIQNRGNLRQLIKQIQVGQV